MKSFPARIVAVLAALAAVLFVAACSSPASDDHGDHEQSAANSTADTSTVATKPADFNDADVSFVTKAMRRIGSMHCILAYLFNTTVLALLVNIGASLF